MLQNEYLVAIVAVHTAENEPSKVRLYLVLIRLYLVLTRRTSSRWWLRTAGLRFADRIARLSAALLASVLPSSLRRLVLIAVDQDR